MPATLICPGCYATVESERDGAACPSCREPLWLDGRLALCQRLGRAHPNVFRGLLRAPDGGLDAVAVKVLDVGGLRDWREHDRFRAQREILDRLAGLPVPRALGDFERGGRVFHCQTLLAGEPLDGTRVRSAAELEELARGLLALLDEIHRRGWVHRDLKPEHVLVAPDGAVQLVDFGAARAIDAAPVEPTVIGTPGYMAPEQLLGDARVESDLYAAGKVLEAAAGATTLSPSLRRLLRALGSPDWRKRPRSAAQALRLLAPSPPGRVSLLAIPAALTLVAGVGAIALRHRAATPTVITDAPQSLPSEMPAPTPEQQLEADARALHRVWESSQNGHDFARYSALYSDGFQGTLKSGGHSRTLARDAWLTARRKMFSPTLTVASDELAITVDVARGRATLAFVQRFSSGGYADHGRKELVVERTTAGPLLIVDERMLDSRPGWDEEDYHRRFPAHGATCDIAFDPSDARFLVSLGRYDDYRDALRAAGKARKRGTPIELVWGEDFEGLDPAYYVVAGATGDRDEARAVASTTHGRVLPVSAARPRFPSVLRFLEERHVESSAPLITVTDDMAYFVNQKEAFALQITGGVLIERFRVPLPSGLRPVRVAVRESHAYVLDESGRWSLIAAGGLTTTRPFDPEPEGRIAVFGDHRFEREDDTLAYRFREGEAHRFPLAAKESALFRLGAEYLLLYRESKEWSRSKTNLFLFEVGEVPRRLTKVCGAVAGELSEAAHVTIGAIDLDTDREGGFELWSAQWGFFAPAVEAKPVCEDHEADCYTYDSVGIDPDVWLFGGPVLKVEGSASCEVICDPGC